MSVALSFTEGTEIHISDTLVQEGLASFTDVISGGVPKEQIGPKKAMVNFLMSRLTLGDADGFLSPSIINQKIVTRCRKHKPEDSLSDSLMKLKIFLKKRNSSYK